MAMRLAALMSLACILMASAEECTNAAWMLSFKAQLGKDWCLNAASQTDVVFHHCHGGSNQQWYQQRKMLRNLAHDGQCLTRDIVSSQFLLSSCDHNNFLQHFAVTSESGSLFIWQDSSCLTLGWKGQTALPFSTSCSTQKHGQPLTKTAMTCVSRSPQPSGMPNGTLDAPLFEGSLGLFAVLVVLWIVMVLGVWYSRTVRMHVLSAIPTTILKTMKERLAELTQELEECRPEMTEEKNQPGHQSEPNTSFNKWFLDQLAVAALKSSVDQLGNLPALVATMETKISSSVCKMDTCAASISALTTSFGRSIQSVAEQLTELTKEVKESRKDQSKLKKIDQGMVDHIITCKSQVDQLQQLVVSMGDKINSMSSVESHEASDALSSTGSLDSWIHIPGGEPCCYLPETYFQVRTADGDEILSPATRLIEGSEVKADDGTWVQVASPPEQHHRPVIKLQADQSFLVVSEDHRIVVRGNQTVLAKELSKDEQVMLDGKTKARLTCVERLRPTMVLKIPFRPDLAVRAFMVPPTILSKGSRKRNFRRGSQQGEEGLVGSDLESEMPNTYRSY